MKIKHLIIIEIVLYICMIQFSFATEIHDAARKGNLKKVKSILTADPSQLEAEDIIGHTPLTLSAAYAHWNLFRYLIETGADVNHITRTNATPLHCACQHDRPDMVELLFKNGGVLSLKVKDIFGEYTPMLRAVQRGSKNVIALLFEKGADPEETTKEGWNALHLAAKCGHRHLYDLLVDKGVPPEAEDKKGKKPMEYDFVRPEPVPFDPELFNDYIGFYSWEDAPEGLGVTVFLHNDSLILDDNCLNTLYPIGEDCFYCSHDPWQVNFYRNQTGVVDRIELHFLRRSVMLNKIK